MKVAIATSVIKYKTLLNSDKEMKSIAFEKLFKNTIKEMLAINIATFSLDTILDIFISPSLNKINSNINTLINVAIELPMAIPTCP